jgi:hypothetical protein
MRPNIACILFLFLAFSCKSRNATNVSRDSLNATGKDSGSVASAGDDFKGNLYIERGRLELRNYSFVIANLYRTRESNSKGKRDSIFRGSYLIVINKESKTSDTVDVGIEDMSGCLTCETAMRYLTDTLHLPSLFVQVVTPAEDVYYTNTFVGYRDGRLEELFHTEDTSSAGVHLRRKNESTLVYFTSGRDDVVDYYESDYPQEVDLKTFKITHPSVEKRYIGFKTAAIEGFKAHRVINGQVDSSLVEVKAGDPLRVDTLYYSRQKVRLLLADSVQVEIKAETARKKIRHLLVG